MNKSEFKMRYDPDLDRYVKTHIYTGEGLMDVFRSVGSKLMGRTAKDMVKKGVSTMANKAVSQAATKTGEHIGNMAVSKAGDKIVQLLRKKQPMEPTMQQPAPMTDFEIAQRVNQLISGGKMKRSNFI